MAIPIKRPTARRGAGAPSASSALGAITGSGGYSGARQDKRAFRTWHPGTKNADEDIVPDLPELRGRSRDLVRNSPVAGAALGGLTTSVVGTGLTLQASLDNELLKLTPEALNDWHRKAERIFNHWSGRCDIRRRQHFTQLQDQVFRSALESGDLFVLRRHLKRRGDLLGLKLQMIEADRVSTPITHAANPRFMDGMELDANGATIAIHVANKHPQTRFGYSGDVMREWKRVTVLGSASRRKQVLHIADIVRPNQTRGVPWLAPVIELVKQGERLTEAELAAAVTSSYFTVFTMTEGAEGLANDTLDVGLTDTGTVESPTRDLELAQGAIIDLNPGEKIDMADPKRPNQAFEPFMQAIIGQIGMRLEIPYEVLTKRFQSSYSAARAAMLEARRFYAKRRQWLTLDFCRPVYEWVVEESVALGLLDAPGFESEPLIREAWLRSLWVGDAYGHVDPQKEIGAYKLMKEEGWVSDSEATQELRGSDFVDVVVRRKADEELLASQGMKPPAKKAEAVPGGNKDDEEEEEEEVDDGEGKPKTDDDDEEVDE